MRLGKVLLLAGVGIAAGGLGVALAPFVAGAIGATGILGAASTGTTIASLTGASLTSASLAALGGGAVSAGGAGIVGGTVAVTGSSAILGIGGTLATAQIMDHKQLDGSFKENVI